MRFLPLRRSLLFFRVEILSTYAKLLAILDIDHPLTLRWKALLEEWAGMFSKELTARDDAVFGQSTAEARDGSLDGENMLFATHALLFCNRDRESLFFKKFFKQAPSELNRSNMRQEAIYVQQTIAPEIEALGPEHILNPYAAQLRSLASASLTAIETRDQAKSRLLIANNQVMEWKEKVNRERMDTYAELLHIASQEGRPRTWADGFFRTEAHEAIEDEEGQEENPASTPAS